MPKLVSGDVTVNGVKLHYYRTGGDRAPIVLVHGITDNGLCWRHLAEVLQETYDVIMYDARGHGLSENAPPDFTWESHAADLAGLIAALELDQPIIMGHSMGASNAALAAGAYPNLARALILEDPPWGDQFLAEDRLAGIEQWKADIRAQQAEQVEKLAIFAPDDHPRWGDVDWGVWAKSKHQVNPDVAEWMRSDMPFVGWRDMIPKISCPILLITGNPVLEALVTPEVAQEVAALSDRVEVARIDAGHSIRREQFEEYAAVVGRFLRFL